MASEDIKSLAVSSIKSLGEGELDRNDIERLRVILQLIGESKYEEAYDEWRAYADDVEPYEDVLIEEVDVVK